MQIDAINTTLRTRTRWEAIDLGFAMARHWLVPIYTAWLVILLPLIVLLHLLCWQLLWLAPVLLWWLKPLLDRIPLFVVSRALFGATPTLAATLKALPKQLLPQAIRLLTISRFDPGRSFNLPVAQLEGLSGKARRQRQRVLDEPGNGSGWLTVTCLHLEIILQFALIASLSLFFPEFVQFDLNFWLDDNSQLAQLGFNVVYCIAMLLMEPFYVTAGFALYLNRRTRLEAWDIELGFRRLAVRLQATSVAILLLFTFGVSFAAEISTPPVCKQLWQQQTTLKNAESPAKQALAEVLQQDEFPHCEKTSRWVNSKPDKRETDGSLFTVGRGVGQFIEWLLWGLLIFAVVIIIIWFIKQKNKPPARPSSTETPVAAPLVIHGQQINPEHFSHKAAQQAWQLWQNGAQRQALALLYRASLSGLINRYQLQFGHSATEDECLYQAQTQLPQTELVRYLQRLTYNWQLVAYAHRLPSNADMQELCEQWHEHFVNI